MAPPSFKLFMNISSVAATSELSISFSKEINFVNRCCSEPWLSCPKMIDHWLFNYLLRLLLFNSCPCFHDPGVETSGLAQVPESFSAFFSARAIILLKHWGPPCSPETWSALAWGAYSSFQKLVICWVLILPSSTKPSVSFSTRMPSHEGKPISHSWP